MIKPRVVIVGLIAAVLFWSGWLLVTSGFESAPFCRNLGTWLGGWGLPGLSASLHESAVGLYEDQIAALGGDADEAVLAEKRRAMAETAAEAGELYLRLGAHEKASQQFEAARELDPGDDSIPVRLAEVRLRAGKAAKAKESLLYLWSRSKKNAAAAALLGDVFAEEDRAADAVSYYEKALAVDPTSYQAALGLGALYQKGDEEQKPKAAEMAQKAVALAKTAQQKRAALAVAQAAGAEVDNVQLAVAGAWVRGHMQQVLTVLALGLLALGPLLIAAVATAATWPLSQMYLRLGRTDPKALAFYRRVLQRRPNDRKVLRALALYEVRINAGHGEAAELAQRFYELAPDDPAAMEAFARAAVAQDRQDPEALAACQRWYDSQPDAPQVMDDLAAYLAEAYVAQESKDVTTIPVLERALSAGQGSPALRRHLAMLYHEVDRHDDAVRVLREVLALEPDDLRARELLGRACVGAGQYYEGYRHLRTLESSDPVDSALYVAAVGAEQDAKPRQAQRIFQEVARRDPSFADVQQHIRQLATTAEVAHIGDYALQYVVSELEAYKVCTATDARGNEVMVCPISQDVSDGLNFPELFERYVARMHTMEHENLPALIGSGSTEEQYYVVTQHCPGQTAAKLLAERQRLSLKEGASLMAEVLRALEYLHEQERTHGDLRLENIVVDTTGRVKVTGSGLSLLAAEALGEASEAQVVSAQTAAPELLQHAEPTPARDVYAAGACLYHLLVGRPPVSGTSRLATMMAHATAELEPPSQAERSLYADVDRVILRAMAKQPEDRFESAGDFRTALLAMAGLSGDARQAELGGRVPVAQGASGEWWDKFDDVDLIGRGRFAKVYRGVDRAPREARAVKELSLASAGSAGGDEEEGKRARVALKRLFQNEMHLLRALPEDGERRGIVRVYDIWPPRSGAEAAYSMELLDETLAERLAHGPLPTDEVLALATELCDVVGRLHKQDIVHRNITPHSIMFDAEGRLRLVGFDRACRLGDKAALLSAEAAIQAVSASPTEALGDPAYMSPERCRSEDFDCTTDVYSLGCVLFHAIAGRPPFVAEEPLRVMLQQLSGTPPTLSELGVRAPAGFQEFLSRCLAKEPADRYQHALECATSVKRFAARPGSGAGSKQKIGLR